MSSIDVGKIKFHWRGDYDAAVAYTKDDVVFHDSSSWVCVANSLGNAPSDSSTFWDIMAEGVELSTTLTAQNDLLVRGASQLERLAVGSPGEFLKVNSSGNLAYEAGQPAGLTLAKRSFYDYTAGMFTFSTTSYQWLNGAHYPNYTPQFATSASAGKVHAVIHFQKGYVNGHAMLHYRYRVGSTEYSLRSDDINATHSSPIHAEFWADGWSGAQNIGLYARAYNSSHYAYIHVPYYMDGGGVSGNALYFAKPLIMIEEWV